MSEAESPAHRSGYVPYRMLSILLSTALLGIGAFVMYHRLDWGDITSLWTKLDPLMVGTAMLLYWLQYPLNAYRMQWVTRWATGRAPSELPSFWFLMRLTCGAGFVAVAAPVGLAGDAAKIAALRLFGSLSVTEAARCALFDRVIGAQNLCIIGLLSLPLQSALGVDRTIVVPQLFVLGGLLVAISMILVFPRAIRLMPFGFTQRVANVFAGYRAFLRPRRLALQLAISVANIALSWGSLYVLMRAGGLTVSPWIVLCFVPMLQLVNGLPFLYMGWGGRELAMAATLGAAGGLSLNETLAVSIAWGVVLIVTSAVNGLFLLGDWRQKRIQTNT